MNGQIRYVILANSTQQSLAGLRIGWRETVPDEDDCGCKLDGVKRLRPVWTKRRPRKTLLTRPRSCDRKLLIGAIQRRPGIQILALHLDLTIRITVQRPIDAAVQLEKGQT